MQIVLFFWRNEKKKERARITRVEMTMESRSPGKDSAYNMVKPAWTEKNSSTWTREKDLKNSKKI